MLIPSKIKSGDVTCRFSIEEGITFQELESVLLHLFPNFKPPFSIHHVDSDGDVVRVSCDLELSEIIRLTMHMNEPLLRLEMNNRMYERVKKVSMPNWYHELDLDGFKQDDTGDLACSDIDSQVRLTSGENTRQMESCEDDVDIFRKKFKEAVLRIDIDENIGTSTDTRLVRMERRNVDIINGIMNAMKHKIRDVSAYIQVAMDVFISTDSNEHSQQNIMPYICASLLRDLKRMKTLQTSEWNANETDGVPVIDQQRNVTGLAPSILDK